MAAPLLTPPPRPSTRTQRMSLRLAPATWVKLKTAAEKVRVAPSELVRHIVETAVGGDL